VGNDFDSPTDAALWQRTVNHDGGAFGDLFERHGDAVYNHCFRRTASWAVAEDLASIVWLETWRRRKDVQLYGESLLPWLLTTANNCLRNFNRSQRRYYHFLAGLPTMKSMEDFGDESAQRMDDERQMSRVLAAMSILRLEEQEVVALCDWSGHTIIYAPRLAARSLTMPHQEELLSFTLLKKESSDYGDFCSDPRLSINAFVLSHRLERRIGSGNPPSAHPMAHLFAGWRQHSSGGVWWRRCRRRCL
jgi:RNA polymerase sigma factor (sigma-70 family)